MLPTLTSQPPRSSRIVGAIATSNNMEPTIRRGDDVFVDTSVKTFVDDGIYVVDRGFSVGIYRVQRLVRGGVVLHCDNRRYDSEIVRADQMQSIRICGRVCMVGRCV